ncbi:MAG: D-aminoacylase [Chloroflexi bacterium]|nr:D-aminoacylase [Chloroflexota bacterium]MCI0577464.1 D-aminoacylase [Chloroflexota bacterium]MCI0647655.1 D-aminoacylase [Chloroflexota bacterium]MCI0730085.1 D-aminoacylase [Chloroflexota bacterium]
MESVDVLIRNGTIYDGSGEEPLVGDVALRGDRIVGLGSLAVRGRLEVDARGLAVAPGFINMMCWANETLIHDGRSQSDIRQGVTLEVLGEGFSMGPLNDELKAYVKARQGDIQYEIEWTTLDEYLEYLARRGVSCNVASFVGAGGVRANVVGFDNRRATVEELARMQALVRQAMAEGALGVSSALIYTPDSFADTAELIALTRVAAEYDGIYVSHLRSEGIRFLEALEEFLTIVRESGARGEIYHLKASGRANWHKLDEVIARVEAARAEGLPVTADMYTYHASATGLDAMMPPWVQEGGHDAWVRRLQDPAVRQRLIEEMSSDSLSWESSYHEAGSAEGVLLASFKSEALKPLTGKSLAEVAAMRGKSPLETAMDLVVEDNSRVGVVYFTMSEENVRKKVALPWVSFCSDSASMAPEGIFLKSNPHPRAYGSFARLLGKYVREEQIISLPEAIRRLAALPARVLKLDRRGRLREGYFADVVVFDRATIQDHATFARPHQYATGVSHVFVNGVAVVEDGDHTGATPGRVVRGPGARRLRS